MLTVRLACFLTGNISQSAVFGLWLPVSWRCFSRQRWEESPWPACLQFSQGGKYKFKTHHIFSNTLQGHVQLVSLKKKVEVFGKFLRKCFFLCFSGKGEHRGRCHRHLCTPSICCSGHYRGHWRRGASGGVHHRRYTPARHGESQTQAPAPEHHPAHRPQLPRSNQREYTHF